MNKTSKKDDVNLLTPETIELPVDKTIGLEINERIKKPVWVAINKNDLLRLQSKCSRFKNKNGFFRKIAPEICLGLSTTFLGAMISGLLNSIQFPNWIAYFCYIFSPILSLTFIFVFILLKVIFKMQDDNILTIVEECVLEPSGYDIKGEKNE